MDAVNPHRSTHPVRRRLISPVSAMLLVVALSVTPAGADHEKELDLVDYWFHGESTDQVHKLDRYTFVQGLTPFDSRTPTFSEEEPDAGDSVTQLAGGFGGPGSGVAEWYHLYWVGEFTGQLAGDLELRLHLEPHEIGTPRVLVKVWADPDWEAKTGVLLGEADFGGDQGAQEPGLWTGEVRVVGHVEEHLVIEVSAAAGLRAYYGSAEHDSGFTLPVLVPVEHEPVP